MQPHTVFTRGGLMLALLLVFLAPLWGCDQPFGPVADDAHDGLAALFSDADFDAAALVAPGEAVKVVGAESEVSELDWVELELGEADTFPAAGSVVDRSALPDARGFIAFVRHNPDLANNPWMTFLSDQASGEATLVYGGRREIQSVAVSGDGDVLVLAMRRTIDPASDFEVYRVVLSTEVVERLTVTEYDEADVSMSADAAVIVWSGEDASGRRAVFIMHDGTVSHLALPLEQRQPSVSGNGLFIGLIRVLDNGNQRVFRYDRVTNTYQVLWGQELPVTLSDPSTSDDGNAVAFLEYRPEGTAPSERELVRYLDVAAGTVLNATAAALTDGPRIRHPHLARDGDHLTYAWRQGEVWNIFTRRMSTGESVRVVASAAPVNNIAPYWQMDALLDEAAIAPSSSTCDGSVPLGGTCSVSVGVVGSELSWRGAEFDLTSSHFSLVGNSARLEQDLHDAGCFTANGPTKVVVGCTGTFVGDVPLVRVSVTREADGASSFVVSEAALVTLELELEDVAGGSLAVE